MPKQGEIEYISRIGEHSARHAIGKPFTEVAPGSTFVLVGCVLSLLPDPAARLLHLGCGTGWLSVFLARIGYDVTAVDIAPDMIAAARKNKDDAGVGNLTLLVGDYEKIDVGSGFDIVVFFDSLHHAEDEVAALASALRALRPGGVCVTAEPGTGHAATEHAQHAVATFDVTEKDMPPSRIMAIAKSLGFTSQRVYTRPPDIRWSRLRMLRWFINAMIVKFRRHHGFVVLVK
jgi:SAM-dependent methyltransferase